MTYIQKKTIASELDALALRASPLLSPRAPAPLPRRPSVGRDVRCLSSMSFVTGESSAGTSNTTSFVHEVGEVVTEAVQCAVVDRSMMRGWLAVSMWGDGVLRRATMGRRAVGQRAVVMVTSAVIAMSRRSGDVIKWLR
jgi:hypothetical protein